MAALELAPWINAAGAGGDRNSMVEFLLDGTMTTFEFNFAGGYIAPTDVKAYTYDPVSGATAMLDIDPVANWNGPNTLKFTPALTAGLYLVIYRDTQKSVPLVDFVTGAVINEENLDLIADQCVFIAAEMADRFDAINATSSDAIDRSFAALTAANAATAASAAATAASGAAVTTANAAAALVDAANTHADEAVATANAIDGKAQSALDASAVAVTMANNASGVANAIAGTAQSALDAANAAVIASGDASTDAAAAVSTANAVDGKASTALANSVTAVSAAGASLQKSANLSDVASPPVARGNLGVPAVADVGLVYLGTAAPSGGFIDLTPLMDNALYNDYQLVGSGIQVSAGSVSLFSSDGTSWAASGYYYAGLYFATLDATPGSPHASSSVTGTNGAPLCVMGGPNNTSGYSSGFTATVTDVMNGACKVTATGAAHMPDSFWWCSYASKLPTPTEVKGLRVGATASGGLIAGAVKLYGYRK